MSTPTNTELRTLIDNLWSRALDMTSPDFKNDDDYIKAQANYKERCLSELLTLLEDTVRERLIAELEKLEALPNVYPEKINKQYTHVQAIYKSAITQLLVELKEQPKASSRRASDSQGHGTQE